MTSLCSDGKNSNMKAKLIHRDRIQYDDFSFAEVVIYEVPEPKTPSKHFYKYRLAYIEKQICVLRYDNETGKGDHKHIYENEFVYDFINIDKLISDFQEDIKRWKNENFNT